MKIQRIADALGVPRCRVRRVLPQVEAELAAQAVIKPGGRSTNGGPEAGRPPEEKGAGNNAG